MAFVDDLFEHAIVKVEPAKLLIAEQFGSGQVLCLARLTLPFRLGSFGDCFHGHRVTLATDAHGYQRPAQQRAVLYIRTAVLQLSTFNLHRLSRQFTGSSIPSVAVSREETSSWPSARQLARNTLFPAKWWHRPRTMMPGPDLRMTPLANGVPQGTCSAKLPS